MELFEKYSLGSYDLRATKKRIDRGINNSQLNVENGKKTYGKKNNGEAFHPAYVPNKDYEVETILDKRISKDGTYYLLNIRISLTDIMNGEI